MEHDDSPYLLPVTSSLWPRYGCVEYVEVLHRVDRLTTEWHMWIA
jgi:hypothetical protein